MAGTRVLVLLLLSEPSPLDAQGTVQGVVVSDSAGTPVAGALVEVSKMKQQASTDARGAFELRGLPEGRYKIQARAVGFLPKALDVRVEGAEPLRVSILLAPAPVVLDSLSVEAPAPEAYNPLMREFSARRKTESGRFLGPDELEKMGNTDLAAVLRLFHVPIRRTPRTNRPYAAARPGRSLGRNDDCPAQVFLDGQLISNAIGPFDISTIVVPNLAGVEYYESLARIPNEFQRGDWECGVLVLWTRFRKPGSSPSGAQP